MMDKDTKELLRRTLSMTDGKELLKFAKSYAAKDPVFAQAIIEKFLPKEDTLDVDGALAECFNHRKKGRARRFGPSLDWLAIRRDVIRLVKRLEFARQQGDVERAAGGALKVLAEVARMFHKDGVSETYSYSSSGNYGNEEAVELLRHALLDDERLTVQRKQAIVQELKRIAADSAYRDYLAHSAMRQLIEEANERLLPIDKMLAEIDSNIRACGYNSDKARLLKRKIELMRQNDLTAEADREIDQHLYLDEIAVMRLEQLDEAGRIEDAKRFCQACADKRDAWGKAVWMRLLLPLCQDTDDTEGTRMAAQWLFLHDRTGDEKLMEYYRTCRDTFDSEQEWRDYCEGLLCLTNVKHLKTDFLFQLYKEERLYGHLYEHLCQLPDTIGPSYEGYQNAGGKRLHFFSRYAGLLTEEQRKSMEEEFANTIRKRADSVGTRDGYACVAEALRLLRDSCKEGSRDARQTVAYLRRAYPNKPAYQHELDTHGFSPDSSPAPPSR